MREKRYLRFQDLENRRVLAGAICAAIDQVEPESLPVASDVSPFGESERLDDASVARFENSFEPSPYSLSYGPDLTQEVDGKLFVVDQHPYEVNQSILHVFERSDDGSIEPVAQAELDHRVTEMFVHGDQILLVGNQGHSNPSPAKGLVPSFGPTVGLPYSGNTLITTVTLGDEVEVTSQKFSGQMHQIHFQRDRVVLLTSGGIDRSTDALDRSDLSFAPVPNHGVARVLAITDSGLRETSAVRVPIFGHTQLVGDNLYIASNDHSDVIYYLTPGHTDVVADDVDPGVYREPSTTIRRYTIGNDSIDLNGELTIEDGYVSNFQVADDGATAVLVRHRYGDEPVTVIDLLSLSATEIKVFESVQLKDVHANLIANNTDHILLQTYGVDSLVVINTNQSIDLAAENRIRRISIPDGIQLHGTHLQVNDDLVVLTGTRTDDPRDATLFEQPQSVALTVSISEGRIIADSNLRGNYPTWSPLHLIDAQTQRIGYLHQSDADARESFRFVFGHLNDDGELIADGSIPIGRWVEIDANANRLVARLPDRLHEYEWESNDEPAVTLLGEADPTFIAVNDQYRLRDNEESHVLDVLANDRIFNDRVREPVRITRLIDAPEGTEIIRQGRAIRVPASALDGVDAIRFEYVISNDLEESSAVVEIDVLPNDDVTVRELVQKVREQASEDLDVPIDRVEVIKVERLFVHDHAILRPEFPDSTKAILVHLATPGAEAIYGANFEGRIVQISVTRTESLVELGLRAVDSDGQPIESVVKGDEFWIEFYGDDLRDFGDGIYAAFFDLEVPGDVLEILGPIEYGPGFSAVRGSTIEADRIDELGATGTDIQHPGGDRQQILRVRVRAVGAGSVELKPDPADDLGTETLLRGRDTVVPDGRVRYVASKLVVLSEPEPDPLDANGNGETAASDALVVINFLGEYGSMLVENLSDILPIDNEGETANDSELDRMRRLDTNRDNTITALDALVVINSLVRNQVVDSFVDDGDDDEEDVEIDMAVPQINSGVQ